MRPLKTKLDRFIAYAEDGKVEKLRAMLDKDPALVNKKWEYGWTALHRACMFGHTDVVRLLIERGANVNAKDVRWRTPAHDAAWSRVASAAPLHLLVIAGIEIDARSTYRQSPIMESVQMGNVGKFTYLLALGARLDFKNRQGLDCLGMVEPQLEPAPGPPSDDSDYQFIRRTLLDLLR